MNIPQPLRCFATTITLLAALTAMVASGEEKSAADSKIPRIEFGGLPLDTAIESLAQQMDINFSLSPSIPSTPMTKTWEDVSARTALTNLLAEHKLFLIENPATSVALISTTNRIATPVDPKWIAADTNRPIPLIHFSSIPIETALINLARQSGTPVTVDVRKDTTMSLRWKNLKPRQAIAAVCETHNLLLTTNTTGGIRIAPK